MIGGAHLKRSPAFFIKSIPPKIAPLTSKAAPIGPRILKIGERKGVTTDDIVSLILFVNPPMNC